ncbi:hypothetical protein [uncultured Xylophilus sp.]|uniref:hypothetical protein n=1 Tax=uncultured Xylophilus sp. TaxID=296832 RepID=UPI0025D04E06|nr:hypothetical protein [uncultured Xylophilus sp.]
MNFLSRAFKRPIHVPPPAPTYQTATIQVNYPDDNHDAKVNALLANPTALKSFAIHLVNQWTPNEIIFYFAVESFRKYPTEAKAILLTQYFIVKDAPHELNITQPIRTTILSALERPRVPRQRIVNHQPISPAIFNAAQIHARGEWVEPLWHWSPRDEGNAHFFEEKHLAPKSAVQDFRGLLRTLGLQGFHFPTALTSI